MNSCNSSSIMAKDKQFSNSIYGLALVLSLHAYLYYNAVCFKSTSIKAKVL